MPGSSKNCCAHAHIFNIPATSGTAEVEAFLLREGKNADPSVTAVAIGPLLLDSNSQSQSTTVTIQARDNKIARKALQIIKETQPEFTNQAGSKAKLGVDVDCFKLTVLRCDDDNPTFDVCFVHGFQGHALRTFASKNAPARDTTIWPRDLLPKLLDTQEHRGRYMTFGYDAPALAGDAIPQTLRANAQELLDQLINQRGEKCNRPLFFVCHSLGGLVVCQAAALVLEGDIDRYSKAFVFDGKNVIQGCAFFGTPFKGNRLAYWGAFVAKSLLLDRFINTTTLNYLSVKNADIENIVGRFEKWTRDSRVSINTFYERKMIRYGPLKWLIVEQDSAKGVFKADVPNQPLHADHNSMVKFRGPQDEIYTFHVSPKLKKLVHDKLDSLHLASAQMNGVQLAKLDISSIAKATQKQPRKDRIKQSELREVQLSDEQDDENLLSTSLGGATLSKRADQIFLDLCRHRENVPAIPNNAFAETCDWVLQKQQYKDWLTQDKSCALIIEGNPGWGKSYLFKYIHSKLLKEQTHSSSTNESPLVTDEAVVCYSPSRNTRDSRTWESILLDILSHLAAKYPRVVRRAARQIILHNDQETSLAFYWNLLPRVLARLDQHVYCLVDGLDECIETEKQGSTEVLDPRLVSLLQDVFDMLENLDPESNRRVKILFMTRRKGEVDYSTRGRGIKFSIQASDTEPGVRSFVEQTVTSLAQHRDFPLPNQELAIQNIVKKAGPVFQIAHQLLLKLHECDLGSKEDIRSVIDKFRDRKLEKVYQRSLEEIPEKYSEKAAVLIRLLFFAQETFGLDDIRHVLAIKIGDLSGLGFLERLEQGSLDFILSGACASLVRVDDNKDVTLDHESVYDYFGQLREDEWKGFSCASEEEGHLLLSLLCVTYLRVCWALEPSAEELEASEYKEFVAKLRKSTFAPYAARFWPIHTRKAGGRAGEYLYLYRELLGARNQPRLEFLYMLTIRHLVSDEASDEDSLPFNHIDPACFLAEQDLHFLLPLYYKPSDPKRELYGKSTSKKLKTRNPVVDVRINELNKKRRTPLHYAAESGGLASARYLLECSASGAFKDEEGGTPFSLAVENGHEEIAQLLLKYNQAFECGETHPGFKCLHWACANNMELTALALIRLKWNPNATSSFGWTPLLISAQQGNVIIFDSLVSAGAQLDVKKDGGFGPLYFAASRGHLKIIQRLFDLKPDLDPAPYTDKELETPLYSAARNGHVEIFKYLRERIADEVPTRHGCFAVHAAAGGGHLPILQLLENSASLHTETVHGRRAIHFAAVDGQLNIMKYLVNKIGVEIDTPCLDRAVTHGATEIARITPLYMALLEGNESIANFLIKQGARIDVLDNEQWTLLHAAANGGCFEAFQLLIGRGLDPLARSKSGATPFHIAASNDRHSIVEYYLAGMPVPLPPKKFSINDADEDGETALHFASRRGAYSAARALLQRNLDPEIPNLTDDKASLSASGSVFTACIEIRCEEVADINARNRNGMTALHLAAWSGRVDCLELLLIAGAAINSVSKRGTTPLLEAASRGQTTVFKLLLKRQANPLMSRDIWGLSVFDHVRKHPELTELLKNWKEQDVSLREEETALLLSKGLITLITEWLSSNWESSDEQQNLAWDISMGYIYLGDLNGAQRVLEYNIYRDLLDQKCILGVCDLCDEADCTAPVRVCTKCHQVAVCHDCSRWRKAERPASCSLDHELIEIGGSEWDKLQPGTVNLEGLKREDWMRSELERFKTLVESYAEPAIESEELQPTAEEAETKYIKE